MAQTGELVTSKDGRITTIKQANVDWFWNQGAELVTNGDDHIGTIAWTADDPDSFTVVETGITADVTEDAEGIQLISENGVQVASIYQDLSLDPTKKYYYKYAVETDTSGTMLFGMGEAAGTESISGNMGMEVTGVGTATRLGKPDNFTNTGIHVTAKATGGATNMVVSTISVREALQTWYPSGRRVSRITFVPGANNDIVVLRNGVNEYGAMADDAVNPICLKTLGATAHVAQHFDMGGLRYKLWLDTENSTLSANSYVIIHWAE